LSVRNKIFFHFLTRRSALVGNVFADQKAARRFFVWQYFFLLLVCPCSLAGGELNQGQIENDIHQVLDRYFNGKSYSIDVVVNQDKPRAQNQIGEGIKQGELPGFPQFNDQESLVSEVDIRLFVDKDYVKQVHSFLSPLLEHKLKSRNIKLRQLKVFAQDFPGSLARDVRSDQGLIREVRQVWQTIKAAMEQSFPRNNSDQKSEQKIEVKVSERDNAVTSLDGYLWVTLAVALWGIIFLAVTARAIKKLSTQLAEDAAPILREAASQIALDTSGFSGATGSLHQGRSEGTNQNQATSLNLVDLQEHLRHEVSKYESAAAELYELMALTRKFDAIFMLHCAMDPKIKEKWFAKLPKQIQSEFSIFTHVELAVLLANGPLMAQRVNGLIRYLWVASQDHEALASRLLEALFLESNQKIQEQFLVTASEQQLKALGQVFEEDHLITIIAVHLGVAHGLLKALRAHSDRDIKGALSMLAQLQRPKLNSGDVRADLLLASLPMETETRLRLDLGIEKRKEIFETNMVRLFMAIGQMQIDEVAQLLSCFDRDYQNRVLAGLPDIRSRRIRAKIQDKVQPEGMLLKARLYQSLLDEVDEGAPVSGNMRMVS
jgi:hypothetical protein